MSYKVCPICGSPAHPNATLCSTCGTSLAQVEVVKRERQTPAARRDYDRRYGEADLLEGELHSRGRMVLFSILLVALVSLCGVGVFFIGMRVLNAPEPTPTPEAGNPLAVEEGTPQPILVSTNTPHPTVLLPTVTPAPPTPTFTATEGPCTRQVQSGDSLIGLLISCGHRSQDVMPTVLAMNSLAAPEALQSGQTILIPWPTPTPDPNAAASADSATASTANMSLSSEGSSAIATNPTPSDSELANDLAALRASAAPTAMPTATLMPGIAWHIVQPNESMVSIASMYQTNAETLAQLNPEIAFSQCDFKYDTGGERCTVLINSGQRIRVPAPTPTPTLSPTLSGSETATFTPTPTYNAPSALSPGNRALFGKDDLITLRWVGSGTLSPGDVYLVTVTDLTTQTTFTAETSELFYIIPTSWQGEDSLRHEYEWTVSVIRTGNPDQPTFTTEARLFTWSGRGDA